MTLTSFIQKNPYVSAALGLATAAATAISPKIAECFSPTPDCGLFTCSTPETICTTALSYLKPSAIATLGAIGIGSVGKKMLNSCKSKVVPAITRAISSCSALVKKNAETVANLPVGIPLLAINATLGNKATCSAAVGTILGSLAKKMKLGKIAIADVALTGTVISQAIIPLQPPISAMLAIEGALYLRGEMEGKTEVTSLRQKAATFATNAAIIGAFCSMHGFDALNCAIFAASFAGLVIAQQNILSTPNKPNDTDVISENE